MSGTCMAVEQFVALHRGVPGRGHVTYKINGFSVKVSVLRSAQSFLSGLYKEMDII